ncbi:MAG TPA: DUF5317 family protein [Candidatus Binatia bacterium]|nr:DUF5317 family protein [Candidatus Binatia bacterium]
MFVLYAVVAGLLVGRLLGGRLANLGALRIRWAPTAIVGLGVQLVLFSEPGGALAGTAAPAIYVASSALVLGVVLRNLALPGLPLVALGAASNLLAIVANGGYMPADPAAVASLGRSGGGGYSNSVVLEDPALRPLTDIFALPAWLPLANVFSVGDVAIAVGVAVAIAAGMRARGRSGDVPPDSAGDG